MPRRHDREAILTTPGIARVAAELFDTHPAYIRAVRHRAWEAVKRAILAEIDRELEQATDPDLLAFLQGLRAHHAKANRYLYPKRKGRPSLRWSAPDAYRLRFLRR
jgi:hypothetical protein